MEHTIEVILLVILFAIIITFFFVLPTISYFKRKEKFKILDNAPEFVLETQQKYKTYRLTDGQTIKVRANEMMEDSMNIYPNGDFNFVVTKSNITTVATEYEGMGYIKIGENRYEAFFYGREFFKPDYFSIHTKHFKDIRKSIGLGINQIKGDIEDGKVTKFEIRYELWKYIAFEYDDKGELI